MYIAFEGIVGSGKSTQVKKLVEYLTSSPDPFSFREEESYGKLPLLQERVGVRCIHVREPGTTPIAEDIRHLAQVKDWEGEHMHPLTNAYLYAAARAQTLHTVVQPALDAGKIVVADRCFLSSCTIQGEAQGLGMNTVLWVNKSAVGKIIPDIIFYLDVDLDLALSRIFDAGGDKFEREGREFYKKIIHGYEKISKWKKLRGRFVRIDANGTEQEVFDRIITYLSTISLGQK